MLPKLSKGERKHRKHKRQLEITIIIELIDNFFLKNHIKNNDLNILEFGCGDGFQIPYLKQIGNVFASDIYKSNDIKKIDEVEYFQCSITDTPFQDKKFHIIFSNHVIEHIEDLKSAFLEMKRIGKPNCIYAFSVPTDIWLILSIPGQYYNKIKRIINQILSFITTLKSSTSKRKVREGNRINNVSNNYFKLLLTFLPTGHGTIKSFRHCLRQFNIKNWKKLFTNNGFSILRTYPILLYGCSEWPLIPTMRVHRKSRICSSVLFLLVKK